MFIYSQIQPISALPVQVKRRSRNTIPKPLNPQQDEQSSPSPQSSAALPVSGSFHQKLLRAVRGFDEVKPPTEAEKPPKVRVDMLQISVLVAMPTPNRLNNSTFTLDKRDENEEEVTIPEVVFGVTRLPYKPPT